MSEIVLMKELLALNEEQIDEARIDYNALKNSQEFKDIQKFNSKLADSLELAWGYPEFYDFINKVMNGKVIGKDKFNINDKVKGDLGTLTKLHAKEFPDTVKAMKGQIRPDHWGPQYERGFFKGLTEEEIKEIKNLLAE